MSMFLYVKPQRKSKVWEEDKTELEGRENLRDTGLGKPQNVVD